jgi:hypothetical protein
MKMMRVLLTSLLLALMYVNGFATELETRGVNRYEGAASPVSCKPSDASVDAAHNPKDCATPEMPERNSPAAPDKLGDAEPMLYGMVSTVRVLP